MWPTVARQLTARRFAPATRTGAAVPRETWHRLFASAEREIGVLAYSSLFLAEDVELLRLLAGRARAGVRLRVLLGDPDSPAVVGRGGEEGIAEAMPAKVRNAVVHYRLLAGVEGVEIRRHSTVLYNSLYRADDDLLVNMHVHGVPAAQAPVLHLHAAADSDLVSTYLASFERVWTGAVPLS
jgi:phosphatidylserine/phosphatidylglycerophosphate/cardiolipin synthase-like enzyme